MTYRTAAAAGLAAALLLLTAIPSWADISTPMPIPLATLTTPTPTHGEVPTGIVRMSPPNPLGFWLGGGLLLAAVVLALVSNHSKEQK